MTHHQDKFLPIVKKHCRLYDYNVKQQRKKFQNLYHRSVPLNVRQRNANAYARSISPIRRAESAPSSMSIQNSDYSPSEMQSNSGISNGSPSPSVTSDSQSSEILPLLNNSNGGNPFDKSAGWRRLVHSPYRNRKGKIGHRKVVFDGGHPINSEFSTYIKPSDDVHEKKRYQTTDNSKRLWNGHLYFGIPAYDSKKDKHCKYLYSPLKHTPVAYDSKFSLKMPNSKISVNSTNSSESSQVTLKVNTAQVTTCLSSDSAIQNLQHG